MVWFRQRNASPTPEPPLSEAATTVVDDISAIQRLGLLPWETIAERADDTCAEEDLSAQESEAVKEALARRWAAQAREQKKHREPGDAQRLDAAFQSLSTRGFVTRMNFWCCQTCALDAIADERTDASDAAEPEWGFVFFHEQDAERLTETPARLYLGFGAYDPGTDRDAADVAAGRAVVDSLREAGLEVTWDGEPTERIVVTITDWRMPLPEGGPRS